MTVGLKGLAKPDDPAKKIYETSLLHYRFRQSNP